MPDQTPIESSPHPKLPEYYSFRTEEVNFDVDADILTELESAQLNNLSILSDVTGQPVSIVDYIKNIATAKIKVNILEDNRTGFRIVFPEPNSQTDYLTIIGWNGARFSRSKDGLLYLVHEVAEEMRKGGKNAAEKLAKVFVNYGHQSVAGLVHFPLSLENIPIYYIHHILSHLSIGDFQETSTRYVGEFRNARLPNIDLFFENTNVTPEEINRIKIAYQELGNRLIDNYITTTAKVREAYENYVTTRNAERENSGESRIKVTTSTPEARTLDIARQNLPVGSATNLFGYNSIRGWLETYKSLRSLNDPLSNNIAELIMTMLSITKYEEGETVKAELAGLLKYAEPTGKVERNTQELYQEILDWTEFAELFNLDSKEVNAHPNEVFVTPTLKPGEALILQYISPLFINVDKKSLIKLILNLHDDVKAWMCEIITQGHNHHDLMGVKGDVRGSFVIFFKTALTYIRDLIRHRATGHIVELQESNDVEGIIREGFNSNFQLNNTPELKHLEEGINDQFKAYYRDLLTFYEDCKGALGNGADLRFILHLLPLGHQVTAQFSGPITQLIYMMSQRWAPGGDIGYRELMAQLWKELVNEDPSLRSIPPFAGMSDEDIVEGLIGLQTFASRA